MEFIQVLIEDAKDQWSRGRFTQPASLEHIATLNVAAVEKIKTLKGILELDFEEYVNTMKEAENAE